MKRTLVWHQGALGDLVLSFPSIHAVKRYDGTDYLHLVSRTDLAGIILRNGLADEVTSCERGFFSPLFGDSDLPVSLQYFLGEYDSAYVFMRMPDHFFMKNIRKFIPRSFVIRTVPPEGRVIRVGAYQLEQVEAAGAIGGEGLPVLDAEGCPDIRPGRKTVTVHPGSGGRKKCWPLARFLEFISMLGKKREWDLCLLCGPAEEEMISFSAGEMKDITLVRNRPLSYAASLLKSSSLFVGNDSGMTHLASALGIPAVAIFGPTDDRIWGPGGKNVRIVRSGSPCSPCAYASYRTCAKADCLESIGVRSVLEAVESLQSPESYS